MSNQLYTIETNVNSWSQKDLSNNLWELYIPWIKAIGYLDKEEKWLISDNFNIGCEIPRNWYVVTK